MVRRLYRPVRAASLAIASKARSDAASPIAADLRDRATVSARRVTAPIRRAEVQRDKARSKASLRRKWIAL